MAIGLHKPATDTEAVRIEDLRPEIHAHPPLPGRRQIDEMPGMARPDDADEGYRNAAVVGTAREIGHTSALIHALRVSYHVRRAVGAKSYLVFTNTPGDAAARIVVEPIDKYDEERQSHFLTIQFSINDAPAPDEIAVALGASIGRRPAYRKGDRFQELEKFGSTHG